LKAPPQLDKLEGGKDFTKKWARSPDLGLTIAPNSDKRKAVRPLMEEAFTAEENN
jgi:hypothetical protein